VAALEALALLDGLEPNLENQVRCVQLALADARARVRDGADVSDLLEREYIERRRSGLLQPVSEPPGGTVYLCAIDRDRTAVSFVQSLFGRFGAGVVAPGTGVVLQNRGACFELQGAVVPGRRPYHTIIPGMLLRDRQLVGPFGVMGGLIQAQAHAQLVSALVDLGLDPQAALDRPRFRIEAGSLHLEEGLWRSAGELERLGYRVVCDDNVLAFGGGQAIAVAGETLVGGSDARKDGYAAGL
jgi:gamma-glutamyltranspeptidase/glutathione hydrolase